jgi:hypothetical protein
MPTPSLYTFHSLSVSVPALDASTAYEILRNALASIPGAEITLSNELAGGEDIPSVERKLALRLRQEFPWLESDEEVSGADVIDTLSDLHARLDQHTQTKEHALER